jgi:inosine/xanthosine triphosphatase
MVEKVIVGSTNPVKIQAVQGGFERMFPGKAFEFRGVSTASGVSDQPASDEEALKGALQRVENASQLIPGADFWVGLEGGIEDWGEEMAAFAWIVVKSGVQVGKARTGTFFLPQQVINFVREGMELGEADDLVFGRTNSKQENGAIGILTENVVDRMALYAQAVVLALVPFKNPDYFSFHT